MMQEFKLLICIKYINNTKNLGVDFIVHHLLIYVCACFVHLVTKEKFVVFTYSWNVVLQESFDPIVEATTGRDLIPVMVYG